MAHDPLFDSAWLKWGWAVRHADALEADVQRFANDPDVQPMLTTRSQYNPKRHAFVVTVDSIAALPVSWGLRLGDIGANFRGALDHLAWAIVSRGTTPPDTLGKGANGIYFPISKTNRVFNGNVPAMLPGACRADIAVVRRYQPYNRGESSVPLHALCILARLNNHDKHRELQLVLTYPTSGHVTYDDERDCVVTDNRIKARTVALKVDAEIRTLRVKKTGPDPHLNVQVALSTQVSLDISVPIVNWLDETKAWIGSLLTNFSEPPLQVHDIVSEIRP